MSDPLEPFRAEFERDKEQLILYIKAARAARAKLGARIYAIPYMDHATGTYGRMEYVVGDMSPHEFVKLYEETKHTGLRYFMEPAYQSMKQYTIAVDECPDAALLWKLSN